MDGGDVVLPRSLINCRVQLGVPGWGALQNQGQVLRFAFLMDCHAALRLAMTKSGLRGLQ